MHDTALALGREFFRRYAPIAPSILDLGAMDLNGSLRSVAPKDSHFVGVDMSDGPGVDYVVEPGQRLPFEDGSYDLVTASSVLEHDPEFWLTVAEMRRVVKPGGHLYINAPSNGHYHPHPGDYWRFYPDAGLGFIEGLRRLGHQDVELVESAIAGRRQAEWNDFFCVLQKAPFTPSTGFISDGLDGHPPMTNIRRRGLEGFFNPEPYTEDQRSLAYLATMSSVLLEEWMATWESDAAERVGVEAREALKDRTLQFLTTFRTGP